MILLQKMTTNTPDFHLENSQTGLIAGVDEAGCGPWAGPVVAAAVIINQNLFPSTLLKLVKDSKKLTKIQRQTAYNLLTNHESICYAIGQASVEEIDSVNLGQATRLAMERAVVGLSLNPNYILVDGIRRPNLPYPVQTVIKGDQRSFSIAAASIIAKVTRDQHMLELDQEHPAYGWAQNAGYGTQQHQKALLTHGVTLYHRRSFAPIKALIA